MTAACREACCSVTSRRTVSELFERGFRQHAAPLPIEGAQLTDVEGNAASFSLDVVDGQVASLGFRATTCATLILIASSSPRSPRASVSGSQAN